MSYETPLLPTLLQLLLKVHCSSCLTLADPGLVSLYTEKAVLKIF